MVLDRVTRGQALDQARDQFDSLAIETFRCKTLVVRPNGPEEVRKIRWPQNGRGEHWMQDHVRATQEDQGTQRNALVEVAADFNPLLNSLRDGVSHRCLGELTTLNTVEEPLFGELTDDRLPGDAGIFPAFDLEEEDARITNNDAVDLASGVAESAGQCDDRIAHDRHVTEVGSERIANDLARPFFCLVFGFHGNKLLFDGWKGTPKSTRCKSGGVVKDGDLLVRFRKKNGVSNDEDWGMVDPNIIEKMLQEQLHPIAHLLKDDAITEIMVNGDGRVWVEKNSLAINAGITLPEGVRALALTTAAKSVNRDVKANSEDALVSVSVGGFRLSGELFPIDRRGTTLCIRKHKDPFKRPSLSDLVKMEMLSVKQADFLLKEVVHNRQNAVFIGKTGSGKTTLANAILGEISGDERIGIIEDAQELAPRLANFNAYLINNQAGVTARKLIVQAMRNTFDRLIVGESRGGDTYDLIRAMSTGHDGSMTTMHGRSAIKGLSLLERLYKESAPADASTSTVDAREAIALAVQLAIFVAKTKDPQEGEEGPMRVSRRVQEIAIIKGINHHGNYEIEYA